MKNNLNEKIKNIYSKFMNDLSRAKDDKDQRVATLLEDAEEEYVDKLKKDIKL